MSLPIVKETVTSFVAHEISKVMSKGPDKYMLEIMDRIDKYNPTLSSFISFCIDWVSRHPELLTEEQRLMFIANIMYRLFEKQEEVGFG